MDNKELEQLGQKVATVDQKVATVDENVREILHLLSGNDFDQDSGLVQQVKRIGARLDEQEKRISKLEKLKSGLFWFMLGMGIPSGVGTWELLKLFIKR